MKTSIITIIVLAVYLLIGFIVSYFWAKEQKEYIKENIEITWVGGKVTIDQLKNPFSVIRLIWTALWLPILICLTILLFYAAKRKEGNL